MTALPEMPFQRRILYIERRCAAGDETCHVLEKDPDALRPDPHKRVMPPAKPGGGRGPSSEMLRVGLAGGGERSCEILTGLYEGPRQRLAVKVIGVADPDPKAAGMKLARSMGIYTTERYEDLCERPGLDALLVTGDRPEAEAAVEACKPAGVQLIDRKICSLLIQPLIREHAAEPRDICTPGTVQDTQTILDSLPYRIMVVNTDMTIHTVNKTFLRENRLDYQDILGKHCYELRYGLTQPCKECGRACYLEEVQKTGETISTIHEFEDETGETRYEVVTVSPILNEKGETVQLLEASRDVTDRIRLEKEVEKSNIFLQNVIQSTVDGIVVVDTKGNVLIFNEGMERLTGFSAEEIMNHGHLSNFYDMDVARANMKKMRSGLYGPPGKLNPTSMQITAKDGEKIPITLTASLITIDGKDIGSVGVFTDMREVLQMRRDLEEAHVHLVQSERIASVGRMAAGVAHEINNPLSGILIYAELLKEALQDHEEHLKDIQEIIDQTLRCKHIVAELLEFSRQSVGKVASFSLDQLITKTLNLLIHQATFQNIRVSKEIEPEMPDMLGDMGQLQQVFTNLFINAADAMEYKGHLGIKARYEEGASRFIIEVSDTGPGIPKELRDKVFDIFFSTKPVGKGTGLGLSISQNIIKLHGGQISFDCPPGGGTTFRIELPLDYSCREEEKPVFIGLDDDG